MIPSMQEPERLQPALRAELKSGVQALRFMAEIERRKLYVERGFSSLFRFCVEGLGLTACTERPPRETLPTPPARAEGSS